MKSQRPVSLHSQLQPAALLGQACSLETGQGSTYSVAGRKKPRFKTREKMPSRATRPLHQPKVPCLEILPTAVVTDSKTSFPPAIPPPPPNHPPPKPLLTLTPLKTKSKSKTQREAPINCTLVSTTHTFLEHHNHQQCSYYGSQKLLRSQQVVSSPACVSQIPLLTLQKHP